MKRKDKLQYYLDIAQVVAKRSTCLRRKYGAIIVKDDEVLSTGYNGAPRGCTNCSDIGSCKREELNIPSGERYELCLVGETTIKMLDGSYETIESLAERKAEDFLVYSVNVKTGDIVPAKAYNVHKTGVRNDIVEIILDNGKSIKCTKDHLFLTDDCSYKEAQELKCNDSFMSMYYNFIGDKCCEDEFQDNHKVVEVKFLNIEAAVYDMTVPEFENFAIDLGDNSCVFAHNCRSVHAEQNAIISASRKDMIGATLYLAGLDAETNKVLSVSEPCSLCKRFILNSGISTVVMRNGASVEVADTSLWRLLDTI